MSWGRSTSGVDVLLSLIYTHRTANAMREIKDFHVYPLACSIASVSLCLSATKHIDVEDTREGTASLPQPEASNATAYCTVA